MAAFARHAEKSMILAQIYRNVEAVAEMQDVKTSRIRFVSAAANGRPPAVARRLMDVAARRLILLSRFARRAHVPGEPEGP